MRCLSCNVELNDHEAVRKFPSYEEITSGDIYIDLCDYCLSQSELGREEIDEEEIEVYLEDSEFLREE
ncbi:MAG: hypothetical protein A3F67_10855 [Verrucomicrobia bacterium RIFCSPHIGHO2_12_FULL_41_10]|nr:MAG: hypothetical protein A3F67_10855 [Verrucomicrobia bacterium RIFCSPHIGHO2_12_FULL_41_10]